MAGRRNGNGLPGQTIEVIQIYFLAILSALALWVLAGWIEDELAETSRKGVRRWSPKHVSVATATDGFTRPMTVQDSSTSEISTHAKTVRDVEWRRWQDDSMVADRFASSRSNDGYTKWMQGT